MTSGSRVVNRWGLRDVGVVLGLLVAIGCVPKPGLGSISGTLYREGGTPVAGAWVELRPLMDPEGLPEGQLPAPARSLRSDSDGFWFGDDLAPGMWLITGVAAAPGVPFSDEDAQRYASLPLDELPKGVHLCHLARRVEAGRTWFGNHLRFPWIPEAAELDTLTDELVQLRLEGPLRHDEFLYTVELRRNKSVETTISRTPGAVHSRMWSVEGDQALFGGIVDSAGRVSLAAGEIQPGADWISVHALSRRHGREQVGAEFVTAWTGGLQPSLLRVDGSWVVQVPAHRELRVDYDGPFPGVFELDPFGPRLELSHGQGSNTASLRGSADFSPHVVARVDTYTARVTLGERLGAPEELCVVDAPGVQRFTARLRPTTALELRVFDSWGDELPPDRYYASLALASTAATVDTSRPRGSSAADAHTIPFEPDPTNGFGGWQAERALIGPGEYSLRVYAWGYEEHLEPLVMGDEDLVHDVHLVELEDEP